jgi:hypothetical protein
MAQFDEFQSPQLTFINGGFNESTRMVGTPGAQPQGQKLLSQYSSFKLIHNLLHMVLLLGVLRLLETYTLDKLAHPTQTSLSRYLLDSEAAGK